RDFVAGMLEPSEDLAFLHRVRQLGHRDFVTHDLSLFTFHFSLLRESPAELGQLLRRLDDVAGAWQRSVLEVPVVRHGSVERGDARDGSVERVEGGLVNLRGDFSAGAAGAPSFVSNDGAAGLFHRLDDGRDVERVQRPEVDYLGVDSRVLERFGCGDRVVYAFRVSDYSHILTLANYIRLAEGDHELGILGNFAFDSVQR